MAQFKPMVKMETTEPSVELKLKDGGHVNMKKGGMAEGGFKKMAGGGACSSSKASGALQALMESPALVGRPAVNALVRSPGKPSMAARKAAMKAPAKGMKKGGMAVGGAMVGMPPQPATPAPSATNSPSMAPKSPTVMGGPASKMMSPKQIADRPMPSQQDYVKSYVKGPAPIKPPQVSSVNPKPPLGLLINRKPGTGLKDPATKPPAMGKPPLSRPMPSKPGKGFSEYLNSVKHAADNFKKGGSAEGNKSDTAQDKAMIKKAFKQHDAQEHVGGKGTKLALKKGGASKKAYATGGSVKSGAPVAMPQGNKKPQPPVRINQLAGTYKDGGKVEDMSKGAYDRFYAEEKAENEAMREAILGFPGRMADKVKSLFSSSKPAGSVTKTEKSVTVTPAKKNGGRC